MKYCDNGRRGGDGRFRRTERSRRRGDADEPWGAVDARLRAAAIRGILICESEERGEEAAGGSDGEVRAVRIAAAGLPFIAP